MLKRSMKYALSLAAGTALLALASSAAGAMPVSAPTTEQASTQATAALFVDGKDGAQIENVYWCGRWGCHPGGWHGGWRGPGWRGPGWGYGYGWHRRWWHHRGW